MGFGTQRAMVSFEPPLIQFRTGNELLAEAFLGQLQRFVVVTCFDPEVAPGPDPTQFDLLDFGATYWLVPDGSAERFLDREWGLHLRENQGYFEAEAGALPFSWRRSYLGVFKQLYKPRAAVVPAEPLSFLALTGPFDPMGIAQRNRDEFQKSQAGSPS